MSFSYSFVDMLCYLLKPNVCCNFANKPWIGFNVYKLDDISSLLGAHTLSGFKSLNLCTTLT